MSKFRVFIVFSLLGISLLAIYWLNRKPELVEPQERAPVLPQRNGIKPSQKLTRTSPPALSNAWAQYYLRMHQEDTQWDWKQPIEFYGKVVDQDGNPLEGVTVECGWTSLEPGKGHSERTLTTDREGRFVLRNARGKTLGITVLKSGYRRSRNNKGGYEFANPTEPHFYSPDPANPVVFTMIKMGPLEPLYICNAVQTPIKLADPVGYDLRRCYTDTDKDIIFTLRRSSRENGIEEWELIMEVPAGGIQRAEGEYPWEAPESGYSPSLILGMGDKGPPDKPPGLRGGRFFLKTPKGYAYLEFGMFPGSDWFSISTKFNPSGSRNLEYNPGESKQLFN
jgi:hypothetical protein